MQNLKEKRDEALTNLVEYILKNAIFPDTNQTIALETIRHCKKTNKKVFNMSQMTKVIEYMVEQESFNQVRTIIFEKTGFTGS